MRHETCVHTRAVQNPAHAKKNNKISAKSEERAQELVSRHIRTPNSGAAQDLNLGLSLQASVLPLHQRHVVYTKASNKQYTHRTRITKACREGRTGKHL